MRSRLLAIGLAVVAAVGAGFVLLADDDDGDGGSGGGGASTTLALPDDLSQSVDDPAREELEALVSAGRAEVVHAVYESRGDTTEFGGELRLELWRDGERTRYDQRFESPEGTGHTIVTIAEGVTTSCSRVDDGAFECREDPESAATELLLSGPAGTGDPDTDVEAYDDVVGGVDARCFRTDDVGGRSSICFDADGVALLLTRNDARLVRVTLDDAVTDADFAPPTN